MPRVRSCKKAPGCAASSSLARPTNPLRDSNCTRPFSDLESLQRKEWHPRQRRLDCRGETTQPQFSLIALNFGNHCLRWGSLFVDEVNRAFRIVAARFGLYQRFLLVKDSRVVLRATLGMALAKDSLPVCCQRYWVIK
jgi:hypothetical protein